MKYKLLSQLEAVMPIGMQVPVPIRMLYEWIESKNLYTDTEEGRRIGFLYPEQDLRASWTDDGRDGGTTIEFMAVNSNHWFGAERDKLNQRLCVFAQTGGDGSIAAFWLSDSGKMKIVHIGSGSGLTLTGILTDDSVEFIRLLAIGYDEICWDREFSVPPLMNTNFKVMPNVEFQDWVENTFCVTIPKIALEIVKNPSSIVYGDPMDEFGKWHKECV